ncbi:type IX secretion system periplasmic lipoprotein PorW/SprE [Flavipsychrobacter stenotrophus]|uniref:type IX secretion system periplasmic lipoprotein PorW/SprE n=1 Tax=Flavipsychrobacter stenotrophus TaxID=2077091 RepID=UPI001056FCFB|nr:hypothetical protein [Flavipsychrobacter stenotrophus]
MNIRLILFILFGCFLFTFSTAHAQTKGGAGTKTSAADSLNAARKYLADSAAAVRKFRNSKHYKDSVARSRTEKTKSLTAARKAHTDSLKAARLGVTKQSLDKRKTATDSLKSIQKERMDKMEAIKKYKGSKRYADSVTISKRKKSDAIKRAIKGHTDSLAAIRKHSMDSSRAIRKHVTDSMKAVRTHFTDSLTKVRKRRLDSLARVKSGKDKNFKAKDKAAEKKKALALEIKMKQKHEAYTNQAMLKKPWRPWRRFVQNGFTHYNYYYNANRKMEEANANMLRGGMKENYDTLIRLYPFDPDKDSALLAADMDSIIHKVSVGIQIHDPRVKWANDLYLLMGQAYYFKGNYNSAAATFKYIISSDEEAKKAELKASGQRPASGASIVEDNHSALDFLKHKSVHNDAILWLARTLVQARQVENGQAVLSLLASDPNLPDDMEGEVAVGKAFAYYKDENLTATSEQLSIAMEDDNLPNWLRMRAAFLNGQIQQSEGKYLAAVSSFERNLDFFPKMDMDFYSRKNIAYNTLMAGGDVEDGTKPLKKVLNDPKYATYYDQVYYVLGKLSQKAKKPNDAIKYLTLSATTPKATKKQKAISYASLGDVYYDEGSYSMAKNSYDSASKYAGTTIKDPAVMASILRSKGLSEISIPAGIIQDQDSLMALSEMSKKEQQAVVRKYLRDLEQKLKDSAKSAQEGPAIAALPQIETAADPAESANWYFSNPVIMQQGVADFKRKWGNRALTDNWRRAAAVGFAGSNNTSGGANGGLTADDDNAEPEPDTKTNGLPSEESLLAKIPNTKGQKDASIRMSQKAYIALAKAYLKQLDDHVQATKTLDTLDARYPNHNQKEEELYLRYQLAIRENKLDKAQAYATEFLSKFPDSKYADLLRPKQVAKVSEASIDGKTVAAYYEETYGLIEHHQYTEALIRIQSALKTYDNPLYKKRFQVAEAMSYAGQANYDMADTLITKFIAANPGDSLTAWASSVSAFIRDVRKTGKPSWYKEGPQPWDLPAKPVVADVKPVESTKPDPYIGKPKRPIDVPFDYKYIPTETHYAIVIFPGLDSRTANLKKAIKSFDSSRGMPDVHQTLLDMFYKDLAVMVVKQFANADEAQSYVDTVIADQALTGYKPEELQTTIISASNYRKMLYDKNTDGYKSFYTTYYKKP